jgi:predicted P-loop ATPase
VQLSEAESELPPDEEEPELIPVSENVIQTWDALGLVRADGKAPIPCADNAMRILEGFEQLGGRIWYDEFAQVVMLRGRGEEEREWTDNDTRSLWLEVQRNLSLVRIGKETIHEAVTGYAFKRKRHPVKEWLSALKWDGVPRIGGFFSDYMGAEGSAFNKSAARNFFVGMIARIFSPGCQMDNMVVLEGVQGARKSSALRALGGKWFTECNDPISNGSNKDFYAVLQGKMLVEIAELDSFSRADIRRIKAIITTGSDRYRPAYGRIAQTFPRTSVFVGTTNEDEYLEDPTGGRRFWPVRVGRVDLEAITMDRGMLFAEALYEYRKTGNWWDMPSEEAAAAQEARRQRDEWEGALAEWLVQPENVLKGPQTLGALAKEVLGIGVAQVDRRVANRLAYCMKVLGYRPNVQWDAAIKKAVKVWVKK